MSDIFVSYASADRDRARAVAQALTEQGWSVWWDRTIPPGKQFDEVIEEALDSARCVVVLWSKASVASQWVKTEAAEAMRRKILVPVLIEDVKIPLEPQPDRYWMEIFNRGPSGVSYSVSMHPPRVVGGSVVITPPDDKVEDYVEADGFRVRYKAAGQGEPIVVLHGGGGIKHYPSHDLLARTRRVILMEAPGFGRSLANERYFFNRRILPPAPSTST